MIYRKKVNKYKNKKVVIDGIEFQSHKEGNRYLQLKLLKRAGEIKDLELQKEFILQEGFVINNKKIRSIKYITDFYYYDNRLKKYVVEDVKSPVTKTQVYNIKKKIFMYKYKIEIKEV